MLVSILNLVIRLKKLLVFIFFNLICFLTLRGTQQSLFVVNLLRGIWVLLFNLKDFWIFFVCISLPSLRFVHFFAQDLMVLFCLFIGWFIALYNLDQLCEKLLGMSSNICDSTCLDMFLNKLPVFFIESETLEKEFMLFVSPPTSVEFHILLSLLVCH